MGTVDNKVAWSTVASAISSLFWFLWAKFEWFDVTWTSEELATTMGFTTTILVFAGGWWARNAASPLKNEDLAVPVDNPPPPPLHDPDHTG